MSGGRGSSAERVLANEVGCVRRRRSRSLGRCRSLRRSACTAQYKPLGAIVSVCASTRSSLAASRTPAQSSARRRRLPRALPEPHLARQPLRRTRRAPRAPATRRRDGRAATRRPSPHAASLVRLVAEERARAAVGAAPTLDGSKAGARVDSSSAPAPSRRRAARRRRGRSRELAEARCATPSTSAPRRSGCARRTTPRTRRVTRRTACGRDLRGAAGCSRRCEERERAADMDASSTRARRVAAARAPRGGARGGAPPRGDGGGASSVCVASSRRRRRAARRRRRRRRWRGCAPSCARSSGRWASSSRASTTSGKPSVGGAPRSISTLRAQFVAPNGNQQHARAGALAARGRGEDERSRGGARRASRRRARGAPSDGAPAAMRIARAQAELQREEAAAAHASRRARGESRARDGSPLARAEQRQPGERRDACSRRRSGGRNGSRARGARGLARDARRRVRVRRAHRQGQRAVRRAARRQEATLEGDARDRAAHLLLQLDDARGVVDASRRDGIAGGRRRRRRRILRSTLARRARPSATAPLTSQLRVATARLEPVTRATKQPSASSSSRWSRDLDRRLQLPRRASLGSAPPTTSSAAHSRSWVRACCRVHRAVQGRGTAPARSIPSCRAMNGAAPAARAIGAPGGRRRRRAASTGRRRPRHIAAAQRSRLLARASVPPQERRRRCEIQSRRPRSPLLAAAAVGLARWAALATTPAVLAAAAARAQPSGRT